MDPGVIIAIVIVAAIILVALAVAMPRMRERSRIRKQEHELDQRRDHVVAEHREQAEDREHRADEAERRARAAEQEAQRERVEAQRHEEHASLHEQGLADHELVEDHEREQFAGTSAVPDDDAADHDAAYANDPRADAVADRGATSGREDALPDREGDARRSRPAR